MGYFNMNIFNKNFFNEKNITLSLILVGLLFLMIMMILTVYDLYHTADFSQLSNWFQAFIAIWTLLAVFYTAMKAKQASDSASELTEKTFMSDLFIHVSEKVNNSYFEHIKKRQQERQLYSSTQHQIYEAQGNNQELYEINKKYESEVKEIWENNLYKLDYINDMLSSIESVIFAIESCKYTEKSFYKRLFLSYLDSRVDGELRIGMEYINIVFYERKKLPKNINFKDTHAYVKLVYTAQMFEMIQEYFNIKVYEKFTVYLSKEIEGA